MASTSKWGLPYPDSTATPDVPRDIGALANSLDNVAKFATGLFSTRPTALSAKAGFYYLASDTGVLYLSDGTNWIRVAPGNEVPIGGLLDWSGLADPPDTRYMVCDGRLLSKTTYAAVYSVVGTAYNATGPTGTFDTTVLFRIPDFRGRTAVAADAGAGRVTTANTVGSAAGAERVTLSAGESGLPAHSVNAVGDHTHTATQAAHFHQYQGEQFAPGGATAGPFFRTNAGLDATFGTTDTRQPAITVANGGAHSHTVNSQSATSSHLNMQPSLIANKIIRVA